MYDSSNFLFYVVFVQYSAQQILKKKALSQCKMECLLVLCHFVEYERVFRALN